MLAPEMRIIIKGGQILEAPSFINCLIMQISQGTAQFKRT